MGKKSQKSTSSEECGIPDIRISLGVRGAGEEGGRRERTPSRAGSSECSTRPPSRETHVSATVPQAQPLTLTDLQRVMDEFRGLWRSDLRELSLAVESLQTRIFDVEMHVTFHDVAVWFTEDEWSGLWTWQKSLYMEVMLENYRLLVSLGLEIPDAEPLQQVFQWEQRHGDGSRESIVSNIQIPYTNLIRNVEQAEDPCVQDLQADHENPSEHQYRSDPVNRLNPPRDVGDAAQLSNSPLEHPCPKCSQLVCQCVGVSRSKKRPYSCIDCGKSYGKESYVLIHQRSHLHGGKYKCATCEKSFQKPSHLQRHLKTHEKKMVSKCKKCKETFDTKEGFIAHRREKHQKVMMKRGGQCDTCGETFKSQTELRQHRRVHRKVHMCIVCDMRFSNKSDFIRHQRDHGIDQGYKCEICSKVCTRRYNYIRHKNSHSCIKVSRKRPRMDKQPKQTLKSIIPSNLRPCLPYDQVKATPVSSLDKSSPEEPCQLGAWSNEFSKGVNIKKPQPFHKIFTSPKEVKRELGSPGHLPQTSSMRDADRRRIWNRTYLQLKLPLQHWVSESRTLFSCKRCRKVFRHQNSLVRHHHSHTKTYICRQCGNTFSKLLHVYIHRIEHENKKPHTCETCRKGFSFKSLLLLHQNLHKTQPARQDTAPPSRSTSRTSSSSVLGPIYQCPHCESCFDKLTSILLHAKLHKRQAARRCLYQTRLKRSPVCRRTRPPPRADTRH